MEEDLINFLKDRSDFLKEYQNTKKTDWVLNLVEKLNIYRQEVINFNKKYNIIGSSTEADFMNRHIMDSIQLIDLLIKNKLNKTNLKTEIKVSDIGTGAGIPGLILAITLSRHFKFFLFEKSSVKRDFLKSIIHKLDLKNVDLFQNVFSDDSMRVLRQTNVIVSRAFKSLTNILHITKKASCNAELILLKGEGYLKEIEEARNNGFCLRKDCFSVLDSLNKVGVILNINNNVSEYR